MKWLKYQIIQTGIQVKQDNHGSILEAITGVIQVKEVTMDGYMIEHIQVV